MNKWEENKKRQLEKLTLDYLSSVEDVINSNESDKLKGFKLAGLLMTFESQFSTIKSTPQYYDAAARKVSINVHGQTVAALDLGDYWRFKRKEWDARVL